MTRSNEKHNVGPVVWVVAVIGAWLASPWVVKWAVAKWHVDFNNIGTFGDSFGALTSLFTGLAFVGLIITLRQQKAQIEMQREDLQLQRGEMKETRDELAGQKEQMELQNQSLRQQMFEQTFFNLLNVFNQLVEQTNEGLARRHTSKHNLFTQAISKVRDALNNGDCKRLVAEGLKSHTPKSEAELWVQQYAAYYLKNISKQPVEMKRYYRILYNILKLVDRSEVEEKNVYTNLLRAQLSDNELQLIALNCAREEGANLQAFIERYDILKHLPSELNEQDIRQICDEIRKIEAVGRESN